MKRSLFHFLSSAMLAFAFSLSASVWAAETISYPSSSVSLRTLGDLNNILAPSASSLTGNKVTYTGGFSGALACPACPQPNAVFGALVDSATSGSVTNNQVSIRGATVNSAGLAIGSVRGVVFGGYRFGMSSVTASGNTVSIGSYQSLSITSNSTITNGVIGGVASSSLGAVAASNNGVTITNGTFSGTASGAGIRGGLAYNSGSGNATASGNAVTISGGSVSVPIYGGDAITSGTGSASNNTVTISGGSMSNVGIHGGAGNSSASGNAVTISGGSVSNNSAISGGLATGSSSPTASNNTVTISGGSVQGGQIYGGLGSHNSSTISNNTVTIRGTPTFTGNIGLYGGSGGTYTGNTLNLHTAGLTVGGLSLFQNLNFRLPSGLAANGTMLTVSGTANLGSNAAISVGREGSGPSLQVGRKFNLIKAGTLSGTFTPPSSCTIGLYSCTVTKEGNNLVLTVGALTVTPTFGPTKNYSGQWISADGESAWGLTVLTNFSNERYIFVPWYTYDNNGEASWYVFQGPAAGYGEWTADDTFTASVYRYKGPKWNTHSNYNNAACSDAVVGTAKLTFTSATSATLIYTNVEGQSRTVALNRLTGAPGAGWDYKYTGQWVREGEKQWGLTVLMTFPVNPEYIFVPWYTYDNNGDAQWYLFQGADDEFGRWTSNTSFEGEVRRYTGPAWNTHGTYYNNSKIDYEVVGTAKLTFDSPTEAWFEYSVEGQTRSMVLKKIE